MTLKNETKQKNSSRISSEAADDRLNLKYQDKAYNESYKKWRRENKDSLGFFYVENPNRITYQENVGFINDYPELQEERSLRRAINVLGAVLILKAIFDIISVYILPYLLGLAGMDIRFDLFTGKLYGDDTLILTVQFFSRILSMILPIGLLIRLLHMPFRVMLPTKITNKPMFMASIPIMLFICGVCGIMSAIYEYLLGYLRIDTARTLLLPEAMPDMIYMIITQIIIIPAVSELCLRGVILQFTRQFGDGIALIITGFITAAMGNDITSFCFIFITSVAIGYFTIRTGSVITAVVMRIISRAFVYALYSLAYRVENDILLMLLMLVSIVAGFAFTIGFLYSHSDSFGMKFRSRYMSLGKKILAFFTSVPIIVWLTVNFIVSIFSINFIS